MDCKDCQNYKPAWTPPVARYKPNKPLPDGAVCVMYGPLSDSDWYWSRTGMAVTVNQQGCVSHPIDCSITSGPADAIRALGLPVWGIDLNCGGETTEEFWTCRECESNTIPEQEQAVGINRFLPYVGFGGRRVTFLRRYHGTRRDGVSVDGWIVKPVAVEKAKPTPGQPCPACGRAVPEPAPFKVGDWVQSRSHPNHAFLVGYVKLRDGEWVWGEPGFRLHDTPADDYILLRPALPPLPQDVKDLAADVLRIPDGYASCRVATARFLRALYPHEFGVR